MAPASVGVAMPIRIRPITDRMMIENGTTRSRAQNFWRIVNRASVSSSSGASDGLSQVRMKQ
jgi:hypothetical protein